MARRRCARSCAGRGRLGAQGAGGTVDVAGPEPRAGGDQLTTDHHLEDRPPHDQGEQRVRIEPNSREVDERGTHSQRTEADREAEGFGDVREGRVGVEVVGHHVGAAAQRVPAAEGHGLRVADDQVERVRTWDQRR